VPIYRNFFTVADTAPMKSTLRGFLADESAATAIEYGLIVALISLAIISLVMGMGPTLNTVFSTISTQIK
jgi:pilus assembly protein Flp/PilA